MYLVSGLVMSSSSVFNAGSVLVTSNSYVQAAIMSLTFCCTDEFSRTSLDVALPPVVTFT